MFFDEEPIVRSFWFSQLYHTPANLAELASMGLCDNFHLLLYNRWLPASGGKPWRRRRTNITLVLGSGYLLFMRPLKS